MIQKTLQKHVGLRAEGMILVAIVWLLLGVGRMTAATPPITPSTWHTIIPQDIQGLFWITTALFAIGTAFFDKPSNYGLGALIAAPLLYFTSYLSSWVIELVPGPPPGDPRGGFTALFYLSMILLVLFISRIPATVRAPLYGRKR